MTNKEIILIPLDRIKVEKHNVRVHDIDVGIEDLAASIKAVGLLQPITVFFNSQSNEYVILAGQRRLNAYHYLNNRYPDNVYDKISCVLIDEPQTAEEKLSLSLAENITQLQMHNSDLVKAVTDLFNVYRDYEMVQEKFGLTKYMIDKYVRLARLPDEIKKAITEGAIHPNDKKAENASIRAVDALGWTKGGDVPVSEVLDLAIECAKGDIDPNALADAARMGGGIESIKDTANKRVYKKQSIDLSSEVAEKLKRVAESHGESEKSRATSYIVKGVTKDYYELTG